MAASEREITTIQISRSLHKELGDIKPYDSMSWEDLIEDMADQYDPQR